MEIKLLASNLPTQDKVIYEEVIEQCGMSASICYMSGTYDDIVARGREGNTRTAKIALGNGHHSVADHIQLSFLIENCSKIVAMFLNSIGCYGTSEKSARYTIMKNCSEEEQVLYDKWVEKLKPMILKTYPDKFDEKQAKKLAMENARLFLSVFTPSTTLKYTVNIKDINYIIDWCERFVADDRYPDTYFYNKLKEELKTLGEKLKEIAYIDILRDHKKRKFDFLESVNFADVNKCTEFGMTYNTYYEGTFAFVAQEERHRTLLHTVYFAGVPYKFYVPEILTDESDRNEWLEDMKTVAHLIPQGTIVGVREQGTLEKFKLKCTERMCGRAQLEIMRQTVDTYYKYREALEFKVSEGKNEYREPLRSLLEVSSCVKCGFMTCKEPCMWGKNANTRLI